MFFYTILLGYFLKYCQTENINSYNKLLSNTPITRFCPNETQNIYKIYEKHPDLTEITTCCATRISHRFMLTEKVCLKKFNPKYITAHSCNKINVYQAQQLFTPQFEDQINGVLLIQVEISRIIKQQLNDKPVVYNGFYAEHNELDWEKNQCTIYGTSTQSDKHDFKYYKIWTTVSNNSVTVHKNCRQSSKDINKWLCPERSHVQFCEDDIGCPMMYGDKLIAIASQKYNWKTWALNIDCGNLDVELRYLYLNLTHVKWIKNIIY